MYELFTYHDLNRDLTLRSLFRQDGRSNALSSCHLIFGLFNVVHVVSELLVGLNCTSVYHKSGSY